MAVQLSAVPIMSAAGSGRVLIFLCKINGCVPAVVGNHYALQSNDQSQEKAVSADGNFAAVEAPERSRGDEAGDNQSINPRALAALVNSCARCPAAGRSNLASVSKINPVTPTNWT